jgi:hypothetical protein
VSTVADVIALFTWLLISRYVPVYSVSPDGVDITTLASYSCVAEAPIMGIRQHKIRIEKRNITPIFFISLCSFYFKHIID